jgi:hypothetical protein
MTPAGKRGNQALVIIPLASPAKRGIKDLMPENGLQLFQVQGRSDPEQAFSVKAPVRYQHMAMKIESGNRQRPGWR